MSSSQKRSDYRHPPAFAVCGYLRRLADISTVGQDALNGLQISRTAAQSLQRPLAVGHVGGRYGDSMRQTLGIDGNMALNARNLFAGVVAFL